MWSFKGHMELEKKRLKKQIQSASVFLSEAPEGTLTIRKRKHSYSYYWNIDLAKSPKREKKQINITKNRDLVLQLTEKMLQQKVLKQARQNLLSLEKCMASYQPSTPSEVSVTLGHQYLTVLEERKNQQIQSHMHRTYSKAPFNAKVHVHETDCGQLVRSKSEQIILNALCAYPLVVHYEEEFLYKTSVPGINKVYPDFTIILPDGSRIIWEHLGMLDDPDYCRRTAAKLNLYQQNGYVIGKNLILTMDDNKGNISSRLVLDAIEHYIMPYYSSFEN